MSSLKFGTSGLRGLVTELPDDVCFAYASSFLAWMQQAHGTPTTSPVLIGYDLRDSSLGIARAVMAAVRCMGMVVENCGPLPTPALALRAQSLHVPAIMVTGSHIPADRNGLKFYRGDGEIDKADEAGILSLLGTTGVPVFDETHHPICPEALSAYEQRCLSILPQTALSGLTIGVYQHSSVARDFIAALLANLGATVVPLGRSNVFVPVDTEALRDEDIAFAKQVTAQHGLDALVSTDGDADRPLLADETGTFFRGDLLGIITAKFCGAKTVVTPVTSTSLVESSGYFHTIIRTKVGSPYVIEGIQSTNENGADTVIGFEANGGVLLGSPVMGACATLPALVTRDAMLPILAVLGMAVRDGKRLSQLTSQLPERFNTSGRLEHVEQALTAVHLNNLASLTYRDTYFAHLGTIIAQDTIDGARFVFSNGDVIHYRASGNAPELRCYAEASSEIAAQQLLSWGLNAAAKAIG